MPSTDTEADAQRNQQAFETLRGELARITSAQYANTRGVSVEKAAIPLLQIGIMVKQDEPRARFASLPEAEFDMQRVLQLEDSSRCLLHVIPMYKTAAATSSEVKLPMELVNEATAHRAKVIKLVKYHFGDHPTHGAELASIISGIGYPDLAMDHLRLANLHENDEVRPVIALDPYFHAEDSLKSRTLANRIYEEIRTQSTSREQEATRLFYSAWTVVNEDYEEIRAGAEFLFRREPAVLQKFPPIQSLGRKPGSPRRDEPEETPMTDTPPE